MEFVDGIVQVEGGPYQTVVFGGQFPEQAEEVLLKVLRK